MAYSANTSVRTGTSGSGKTYNIGSEKGLDFVNNAAAGSKLTGGDGSAWTKNADGSTTISKNGETYTVSGGSSKSTGNTSNQSNTSNTGSTSVRTGTSGSGKKYNISTEKGLSFLNNAAAGSKLTGGDGSAWTKNADGSTTISKNGETYTVNGSSGKTNPVGWNTAWGEYKAGVNDFTTQMGSASSLSDKAAIETARNSYIDAAGLDSGMKSTTYIDSIRTPVKTTSFKNRGSGSDVQITTYRDYNGNLKTEVTVDGQVVQPTNGMAFVEVEDHSDEGYAVEREYRYNPDTQGWDSYESVSLIPLTQQYTLKDINDRIAEAQEASIAETRAATEANIEDIKAQLESGVEQYSQDAAEEYLHMLQAQRNAAQRNAVNGDLGGIGNKQYDSASAQYDAALLQVALEREAFINDCNAQINALEAEGRLQEAQLLSDWAQVKLESYNNYYQYMLDYDQQQQQIDYAQSEADRDYAYKRAVSLLESGIITADALEVLGVSEEDAQNYANRLNEEATISLAYAQAQLDALVAKSNTVSSGSGSNRSSDSESDEGTSTDATAAVTLYDAEGNPHTMLQSQIGQYAQKGWTYTDGSGVTFTYNNGTWESPEETSVRSANEAAAEKQSALRTWFGKYNQDRAMTDGEASYNALYQRTLKQRDALEQEISDKKAEIRRLAASRRDATGYLQKKEEYNQLLEEWDTYNDIIEEYDAIVA